MRTIVIVVAATVLLTSCACGSGKVTGVDGSKCQFGWCSMMKDFDGVDVSICGADVSADKSDAQEVDTSSISSGAFSLIK